MDHAATIYRANHPKTILDQRSIRDVQPEEILEAIKLKAVDLDFLDGSPPCDSFSTAGVRQKGWGKEKAYYGGKRRQRTDDLFFEYVRILDGLRPRMFIAENVTGLIKGAAKGRFLQILKALKGTGYRVEVRVLDAQWLGVPQCRQRVIFQGSRDGGKLFWPKPHKRRISLAEAIGGLVSKRSRPLPDCRRSAYSDASDKTAFMFRRTKAGSPAPTISTQPDDLGHWSEPRQMTIPELKAICSFPPDYKLAGSYGDQWAVCGMSVPPLMMYEIAKSVRKSLTVLP